MERRRFLGAAASAGLLGLAGCGGDATGGADIEPANAGEYGDRFVRLEGSYLFLMTYYPEYAQTLDWLPEGAARSRIVDARAGATAATDPAAVESYFEGFTRNGSGWLSYADARGSFDASAVVSRLGEYERADAGVDGYDVYGADTAAVALAGDRLVWAQVSDGDPVAGLETVLATYRGERASYASADEDLGLLAGALADGHRIDIAPSNAGRFGASQYGRQFVFGPERVRPEEALVFDDLPDDVRSRFEEESAVPAEYETSLARVETDGRTARAVYEPIPNTRA